MPAEVVAKLRELIASGRLSPEKVAEAESRIAKYEASAKPYSAPLLGSPTAKSGIEALESNELFTQGESGEYETPGRSALDAAAFEQAKGQAAAGARPAAGTHGTTAGAADLNVDLPSDEQITEDVSRALAPGQTPMTPTEAIEAELRALDAKDAGDAARSEIPTLSRSTNPALVRPPEFKPADREGALGTARSVLPGLAPGFVGTYYRDQTLWHEPSPDEFREVVRPLTQTMPEDWQDERVVESEAYKRYADARWAEAFDKAQAEGRPIVRVSMQDPTVQRTAKALDALHSVVGGADEALSAGLVLEGTGHALEAAGEEGAIDDLRAQRARVPAGRMAGLLGGSVSPIGVAGSAARGGLRAAQATGLQSEVAKGLVGGAVGTLGQTTAEEAVRLGSDVARGLPVDAGDLGEAAAHIGLSTIAGSGAGALLGAGAGGAQRFTRHMRQASPLRRDIADLEAGGGRVKMTGGIEETPEALALRQRANEAPGMPEPRELVAMESAPKLTEAFGNRRIAAMREAPETAETVRRAEAGGAALKPTGDIVESEAATLLRGRAREHGLSPAEVVSYELVQPLAKAHLKHKNSVLKPLAEQRAAYHEEMRSTYVPATEYAQAVYDNLQKRILTKRPGLPDEAVGQPLPEADVSRLRKAFERVFIPRQVPKTDVEAAIAKGWIPVTSGVGRAVGMPKAPGFLRFVEPMRLNPIELEETLSMLARRAGHKTGSRPADPVDLELDMAARKVRDRFPASPNAPDSLRYRMPDGTEVKGYSALNARYSEAARELGDQAELAGLPREFGTAPQRVTAGPATTDELSELSREELLQAAKSGLISDEQWNQLSRGMFDTQYMPFFKRIRSMEEGWKPSPFQRIADEDLYMELIRETKARPATDNGIGKVRALTVEATQKMSPGDVRLIKELSRDLAEREGVALTPRETATLEKLAVENPTDVAGGSLYSLATLSEAELRQMASRGSVELRSPLSATFDPLLAKTSRRASDQIAGGEPVLLQVLHADKAYSLAGENVGSHLNQMALPPGTRLRLISEESDGNFRVFNVRAETPGVTRAKASPVAEPEAKLTVPESLAMKKRIQGYRSKEGRASEDMALRTLAGRATRGADLDTLESIGAVDKLQGKIVTPADVDELKSGIVKYRRASDRTEKDNAFRELARDAGVTQELDTLASVNAADSLRGQSKVHLGVGITPSGAYPRAGGSVGNRAALALYGAANEAQKPFVNQAGGLQVSDRLRALLHAIRLDPRAGQLARQGILPKPSDYSMFGLSSGGMATRGVTGAMQQGQGEVDAGLSESQVQAILHSDENTSAPLTPEEMQMIAPLLEQWRQTKEQRP